MLKNIWKSISLIGIKPEFDDILIRRIILTNQFTSIGLFVVSISAIIDYTIGDVLSAIILGIIAFLSLLGITFFKNRLNPIRTSFQLILFSCAIFYFDSNTGVHSGSYLYYFPMILAISFVFDFREKKQILFHFALLLGLALINLSTEHRLFANRMVNENVIHIMYITNFLLSSVSIAFFIYISISNTIRENDIYENRINERKQIETSLKQALSEKEILLSEIHHRVKNNLAIITSLLNLQMSTVKNQEAISILLDSKNRVKSMALIHDRLYASGNLTDIDFEKYTSELIDEIKYSYPLISNKIIVNTHINNVSLNVNNAIPLGLILNELLTNCYKHAFIGRENGIIDIYFSKDMDKNKLIVKDNGIGTKEGFDKKESLGMIVITSLSDQIDAKIKFKNNNGTIFELEIDCKKQKN